MTTPSRQASPRLPFTITAQQAGELSDLAGSLAAEADRCAEANCWSAAIMLITGSVEAALLATVCAFEPELREQGQWPPRRDDPTKWTFGEVAEVARKAGWLPAVLPANSDDIFASLNGETGDALRFAARLRNMIVHPGAYIREELKPDVTDEQHMQLTYQLIEGILFRVFDRLGEQLTTLRK